MQIDSPRSIVALWARRLLAASLLLALGTAQVVRAEESTPESTEPPSCCDRQCSCDGQSCCDSQSCNERGIPLFSNVPYVNRLFKNVGKACDNSSSQHCDKHCEQHCDPSLCVVEFQLTHDSETGHVCREGGCPCFTVWAPAECDALPAPSQTTAKETAKKKATSTTAAKTKAKRWKFERREQQLKLAVLEAVMELQNEFHEEHQEFLESMFETAVENARLQAQLEFAEHHVQMLEVIAESKAENARLTAQLEVASRNAEMAHALASASQENSALKARLAELEALCARLREAEVKTAKAQKNNRK